MRERWWFGRSVGGWASGFVAMCGSRVLQFCFLDPSCFRTAVVAQGGWVDRFVGYVFFFLPLYQPRAGIVQSTTNNNRLLYDTIHYVQLAGYTFKARLNSRMSALRTGQEARAMTNDIFAFCR